MEINSKPGTKRQRQDEILASTSLRQKRGRSSSVPDTYVTTDAHVAGLAPDAILEVETGVPVQAEPTLNVDVSAYNSVDMVDEDAEESKEGGTTSEDEGDDDEDEDDGPPIPVLRKVLPQRETRGTRMGRLVGEAAEADEQFWGQTAFTVGSSEDEEFSSSDAEALSGTTCSSDSDIDLAEPEDETDFPRAGAKPSKAVTKGASHGREEVDDSELGGKGGKRYVDKGAAGVGGVNFKAAVAKAMKRVAQGSSSGQDGGVESIASATSPSTSLHPVRSTRASQPAAAVDAKPLPQAAPTARGLRTSTIGVAKESDVSSVKHEGCVDVKGCLLNILLSPCPDLSARPL